MKKLETSRRNLIARNMSGPFSYIGQYGQRWTVVSAGFSDNGDFTLAIKRADHYKAKIIYSETISELKAMMDKLPNLLKYLDESQTIAILSEFATSFDRAVSFANESKNGERSDIATIQDNDNEDINNNIRRSDHENSKSEK